MGNRLESLEEAFAKVGPAHHKAYRHTNGEDPEWAIWYTDFLKAKLESILEKSLTRSELIYFLVLADKQHRATASNQPWPRFYAELMLSVYP